MLRDLASSLFTFYFLLPTEKGMGHGASHPRLLAPSGLVSLLFTSYCLLAPLPCHPVRILLFNEGDIDNIDNIVNIVNIVSFSF